MNFCIEAERFVDDKLSNWYVRRNKRPFQKEEQDAEKLGAYQTLYTVLTTLAKLFAPVMPFLTETMYQNLVVATHPANSVPSSVHHCDYPRVEESLLDTALLADMQALLNLVNLGLSARNAAKIKVRQPLAEMRVRPGDEADRRAVQRFADQIKDELNVKAVTLSEEALLKTEAKLTPRSQGKFGPRIKEVTAAIAAADPESLAVLVGKGEPFQLGDFDLEPTDITLSVTAPEGFAGVADRKTQAALDVRLTPELAAEGMARDIVRLVQDLRKNSGLQIEDRITLYLASPVAELQAAIETHWATIAGETLATDRATSAPSGSKSAKVEGKELTLGLVKA
jgi:isoleucyl-tRNA synthetase